MKELIHFTADWCGPCKKMKPIIQDFIEYNPDIKYTMIDVDKNPEIANKYDVQSIPTLISIVDDKIFKRRMGAGNRKSIEDLFDDGNCFDDPQHQPELNTQPQPQPFGVENPLDIYALLATIIAQNNAILEKLNNV